jgi:hypothetical protein
MQHSEVEISRLHSVAICKEISERLAICLNSKFFETPPNLIMLARDCAISLCHPWPPVRASRRRRPRVEMRDPAGRYEPARYPNLERRSRSMAWQR